MKVKLCEHALERLVGCTVDYYPNRTAVLLHILHYNPLIFPARGTQPLNSEEDMPGS